MKGVVSRFAREKVLKAFSLEACVDSTRDAVLVTRQAKLPTLVKAARRYDVPVPENSEVTNRHTHTHGIPVLL